jgi:hypothetical protein
MEKIFVKIDAYVRICHNMLYLPININYSRTIITCLYIIIIMRVAYRILLNYRKINTTRTHL